MKSKLKTKGLAILMEVAIDKAYTNLQLGEPSKKIVKIMARASKSLAAAIKAQLKEQAHDEKKRRKKESQKARRVEKKLKKQAARLEKMSA